MTDGGDSLTCWFSAEFSVTVVNGKFTWGKEDPPVLHKYVLGSAACFHCVCVRECVSTDCVCVFAVLT